MAFSNEFVYGYHGCSRDVAEMLLSGKDVSLNSSENDYDWLGSGIYFWEEAPHRALEWAREGWKGWGCKAGNRSVNTVVEEHRGLRLGVECAGRIACAFSAPSRPST